MTRHDPDLALSAMFSGFAPVSLAELNARAEMLARIDNKYIVPRATLERLLPSFERQFDVLEIDGRRAFTYETRYYDAPDRAAYYEHHQGLRKGFKVRVRNYADAGVSFLEVKVKGTRGMTVKHRLPHAIPDKGPLPDAAMSFARETYEGHYGKAFDYDLHTALDISYKRMTLVARDGAERMTIDTDLQFSSDAGQRAVGTEVFIIETKSALGRGFADRKLREAGQRPTGKCSKYCVGMAALGEVSRANLFLPVMRRLGIAPGSEAQALARAA